LSPNEVFQAPHFTFWTVLYTALGCAFFWGRNGRTKLKVWVLSWLFDAFKVPDNGGRQVAEFILFVTFGVLIGIPAVRPQNAIQALTAGFAWTGVVARPGLK
jgi:hypothetical protein